MDSLFCWIYGQDVYRMFPIKILEETMSFGDLKEVIKNEKFESFRNVEAAHLELYFIADIDGESTEDKLEQIQLDTLDTLERLRPQTKISKNFTKGVVIVKGPEPALGLRATEPHVMSLNCWVRGQELHTVFSVKISTTALIANLKEVIKNERPVGFRNIDADTLALYKVSIPFDDRVEETVKGLILRKESRLLPLKTPSYYFPEAPLHKHIHIVVEAPVQHCAYPPSLIPSLHDVKAQRLKFLRDRHAESLSNGANPSVFARSQAIPSQTIYCNRPYDACDTIPSALLHRAFGEFLDDCEVLETTSSDNFLTEALHVAMSNMYDSESDRASVIRDVLTNNKLHFNTTHLRSYETDGDMSVGIHRYAIIECKDEVCSVRAEPYYQAGLYYLEATRDHAAELDGSCLPCIFILVFGPYIAFAAATWTTRPVIEPLSVVLPMHYHYSNTSMQREVARHLGAFRKTVDTLKRYYEDLIKQSSPASSPMRSNIFPYPTDFTSLCDNGKQRFEYKTQVPHRLLFKGTLDDKKHVYIKFVTYYSKEAHLACASLGCAPMLHGFEVIPGGWFMVIMEDLEEDYIRLSEYSDVYNDSPTAELLDNIENVLRQLHGQHYVHGNVRSINILVSRTDRTKFVLVDFDWAGRIKEVRYPMNVNRTVDLWRPDDVIAGALIKPEHDLAMLDDIRKWCGMGRNLDRL